MPRARRLGRTRIICNAGANRLDGGAGNDTLTGGAGDDTYAWFPTLSDDDRSRWLGGGADTVQSQQSTWSLGANARGISSLLGGPTVNGTGATRLDNVLTGNSTGNYLADRRPRGADTMAGGLGRRLLRHRRRR